MEFIIEGNLKSFTTIFPDAEKKLRPGRAWPQEEDIDSHVVSQPAEEHVGVCPGLVLLQRQPGQLHDRLHHQPGQVQPQDGEVLLQLLLLHSRTWSKKWTGRWSDKKSGQYPLCSNLGKNEEAEIFIGSHWAVTENQQQIASDLHSIGCHSI